MIEPNLNPPPECELEEYIEAECLNCLGEDDCWATCKECGQVFDTYDVMIFSGICYDCLDSGFSIEIGKQYLADCNGEEAFYVEHYFNCELKEGSFELLELCKGEFDALASVEMFKENATEIMKDFIFDDLSHYAEWLSQNKFS